MRFKFFLEIRFWKEVKRRKAGELSFGAPKENVSCFLPVPYAVKRSIHFQFSSVAHLRPTLRPHGLQHARLPCPSPIPRAYSNSCPLCWWCHPTISSSVVPFSSRFQSFPALGSFQMSHLDSVKSDTCSNTQWEAWCAAIHGVAKSRTRLKRLRSSNSSRGYKTISWSSWYFSVLDFFPQF